MSGHELARIEFKSGLAFPGGSEYRIPALVFGQVDELFGIPYTEGKAMKYEILWSNEFKEWFFEQTEAVRSLIEGRLERIEEVGHFGYVNRFDGLVELKWVSGLRVYTFVVERTLVVVLYGGNKNGQQADIKNAQKIRKRWIHALLRE